MGAPITVAVDGPAASGKGTIAKAIAEAYGVPYLDSGLLYRAMAFISIMRKETDPALLAARASEINEEILKLPRLRDEDVSSRASQIAREPAVRSALRDLQHAVATDPRGAVIDGRDIGTVIMPSATAKIFVTAFAEVRAQRRHAQLIAEGRTAPEFEAVLAAILERDRQDSTRAASPLKIAPGAFYINTSNLTIEESIEQALSYVESRVILVV